MTLEYGNPGESESSLDVAGLTDLLRSSAKSPDFEVELGTRFGDITIVRLVGEGGMGRVYEGRQSIPSRTVAVKVVHPDVVTPVTFRRFEYEAQILGRLTHPGIARIYSAGTQTVAGREVPYFAMEYIDEALPITAYATTRRLSIADRVRLFRDACVAVAHGHRMGIIHRDLKPANVLVDATGGVRIIDFGVAHCTEHEASLATMHTTAGHLVGTLQYMSPEQFDGSADTLDVRVDVYSLGVVLYELLTGRLPYDINRRAVYDAARIVKEVVPAPLSRTSRHLRGDLETIAAKCLEKDRSRRYANAADLESDLARHLRGESIAARPPGLLDGVIRLARRHPLAAAATAGMVAALGFGLAGITVFAWRAEAARQVAVELAGVADREKARADVEATTAKRRLYVANLQAMQACLDKKNVRLARQLEAENATIAGPDLPLEMLCLSADLDDALAVVKSAQGPVTRLEYSSDGRVLAAASVPLSSVGPRLSSGASMFPQETVAALLRSSKIAEPLLLAITGGRPEPATADEAGWAPAWATPGRAQGSEEGASTTRIQPLAVSLDGSWAAMPAPEGRLRIVNTATGQKDTVIDVGRGQLMQVEFLAGRPRLATLTNEGRLTLWELDSGRALAAWGDDDVAVVRFHSSADGSRLALVLHPTGTGPSSLALYDTVGWDRLATLPMRRLSRDQKIVAFSPDSRFLITSYDEPDLHVWSADDGTIVARLPGNASPVRTAIFAPDGGQIATGAGNGLVSLWNTRTWSLERSFMGHPEHVIRLAFSPDGATLASGSIDGTVRIWPRAGAPRLAELPGAEGGSAVAFSPTGDQLAVARTASGDVELWNPLTAERLRTLDGPGGDVQQIAYAGDGSSIAAAFAAPGQQGAVRVWDSANGERVATFAGHKYGAKSVAFSPDGRQLLTTSAAGQVMTWDLHTGRNILDVFPGPFGRTITTAAVFGLGGKRIATRAGRMFDATTGDEMKMNARIGQVSGVAVSPEGRTAALARVMGYVNLVDLATGEGIAELAGHTMAAQAITFSPDGRRLVTGSLDGTARLWDARSGAALQVLRGHEGPVNAVLFTPDGGRVVTASRDGTVRIWDVTRGQQLLTLPGQTDIPEAIALAPDGRRLVTVLPDGKVRIWGISNAAITAARAAAAGRRPPAAPRARAETPPDRQDPAG
jgi:eukaryotic-like serine/threonine-protein kinase